MLLQSSKRWYTVITDRRLSRAKGGRNPSLFFALFCFFLPGRELKEHLMWILWGNKDQKSCTQIKMQMCSSVLLCCQHKKPQSTGAPVGTRTSPGYPGRQCQSSPSGCPFRVPTHPQANIKPQHLEMFVLWTWSENVLGTTRAWEIFHPASPSLQHNAPAANPQSTENTFGLP